MTNLTKKTSTQICRGGGPFSLLIAFILISFVSCKTAITKPSEIAVSNLQATTEYTPIYYTGGKTDRWTVVLSWEYKSADPATFLITRNDYILRENQLKRFELNTYTDTISSPGEYTYKVYTVGNGFSTSASASVKVNCEYINIPGDNNGGGGNSSSGESKWYGMSDGIVLILNKDRTFYMGVDPDMVPNQQAIIEGTYEKYDYGKEESGYMLYCEKLYGTSISQTIRAELRDSETLYIEGYGYFTL